MHSKRLVVGVLGIIAGLSSARAGVIINYPGFASTSGLTLVGSAGTAATGDGTVLRVVPSGGNLAGAAYSTTAVMLGAAATFSTQFQFRLTNPGGVDPADGFTFVVAASPNGLGGAGFGMGYNGVSANSIAVEFDTYNNGIPGSSLGYFSTEPNSSNHVAIDVGGALTNSSASNVYGLSSCGFPGGTPSQNAVANGCMTDGNLWTVNIGYNGATSALSVTLFDPAKGFSFVALNNYNIDLSALLGTNTAYVGFTSSTGAGWTNHDIVNWTLTNDTSLTSQTPEPGSMFLLGSGLLGALVLRIRRRRA